MKIDVKIYNAAGNGLQDDTLAIQTAINTCNRNGGGTVIVSPGVYMTGTLELKNHVTLALAEGAELRGIQHLDAYPAVAHLFRDGSDEPEYKGYCLIYAYGAKDIAITGKGIINGQGRWFSGKEKRPFVLRLIDCDTVRMEGITLKNSGAWCFHLQSSNNIKVENITLKNPEVRNADGIDIDSCQNVVIKSSTIDSHDDAICLKSTSFKPTSDVLIEDCRVRSGCSGIKIGTESVGDYENIRFINTEINDCGVCAVKVTPVDGAYVNNVLFSHIKIKDSTGPIFVATGHRQKNYIGDSHTRPSRIKGLRFEDVTITTKRYERLSGSRDLTDFGQGIVLSGRKDGLIEDVVFKNVTTAFYGGVTASVSEDKAIPIIEGQYPECHALGLLPSWGYYLRHVRSLAFDNCHETLMNDDVRPMTIEKDVTYVTGNSKET